MDILCSSLSKIFNGEGDAMAGSLVVNSRGARSAQLRESLSELQLAEGVAELFEEDAAVVEANSRLEATS